MITSETAKLLFEKHRDSKVEFERDTYLNAAEFNIRLACKAGLRLCTMDFGRDVLGESVNDVIDSLKKRGFKVSKSSVGHTDYRESYYFYRLEISW